MYVMMLFALVLTGEPAKPILPITRPEVGYYINESLCKADLKKQVTQFASSLPESSYISSKCVKITGPVETGEPA